MQTNPYILKAEPHKAWIFSLEKQLTINQLIILLLQLYFKIKHVHYSLICLKRPKNWSTRWETTQQMSSELLNLVDRKNVFTSASFESCLSIKTKQIVLPKCQDYNRQFCCYSVINTFHFLFKRRKKVSAPSDLRLTCKVIMTHLKTGYTRTSFK